jgi:hypothetical protein
VLVAGGHEPVSATVEVTSGETTSVVVRVGGLAPPPAAAPEEAPAAPAPEAAAPQLATGHGE